MDPAVDAIEALPATIKVQRLSECADTAATRLSRLFVVRVKVLEGRNPQFLNGRAREIEKAFIGVFEFAR